MPPKNRSGNKPNVLLILVDGLPSWILGCYGNREVRTPQIDRLAQIGTRFLNHYACAPVADKARATLLTGRTTMQLKDAGEVTLEKLLGGIGYACGTTAGGAEAAKFLDAQSCRQAILSDRRFHPLRHPAGCRRLRAGQTGHLRAGRPPAKMRRAARRCWARTC